MIKVTFESTENDHKREFSCAFDDGVTWTTILELGVWPVTHYLLLDLKQK